MRLLLIEDDRDAAGYLVKALTETSYTGDHAADGRDELPVIDVDGQPVRLEMRLS